MNSKIYLVLFVLSSFMSFASEIPDTSSKISTSCINIGAWYELKSNVLDETREFAVYLPPSYPTEPQRRYPVLYVLDGHESKMRAVAGMVESLTHHEMSRQIPEFIIVAIPSNNRTYDLTPTESDLTFNGNVLGNWKNNSGGADKFINFFQNELFPLVDSRFRTSQQRGIIGMSLGGLFVAHTLMSKPSLFSDYLIADATFVWDENYLNRTLQSKKKELSKAKANIFIGLANNEHLGDVGKANMQWGNDFINGLKKIDNDSLRVSSKYFNDEQHGTVMLLAFYHGLVELYK